MKLTERIAISIKERIVICGYFAPDERDWLLDLINRELEKAMISNDDIDRMTPDQLNAFVTGDTPLAKARNVLQREMASIISEAQSHGPAPNLILMRRMELKAVLAIINVLGVRL